MEIKHTITDTKTNKILYEAIQQIDDSQLDEVTGGAFARSGSCDPVLKNSNSDKNDNNIGPKRVIHL